jgi:membrane fusion protein (multidrug efflux system)
MISTNRSILNYSPSINTSMKNRSVSEKLNTVKLFNTVMKFSFLLITSVLMYSCASKPAQVEAPPAPSLPVAQVSAGNQTTYQEYPASIEGTVNVEIRPQVDGTLDKVFIDEGAYVSKGQPLFKINDRPYREQLNNAMAGLHAAEGAVLNAQLEVDKLTPLVQNKVVSDFQLKTAKASYKVATANAEQAKAAVATAQINVGYTTIKAPVNGYIGRLLKKQGSLVSHADAQPLTDLSDVHEVHVYFALGEADFINFKAQYAGNSLQDKLKRLPSVALLLADNSVYPLEGKIDMIDGQFDKTTGAITVRASFPNSQGLLRSGNTGKIRLSLEHSNALVVPQSATLEMQDKIFVYAVKDSNKVSKQAITIIGKSGNNYLVKDGIKAGDRIVLSGIDHLQEGEVIKPENEKPALAKN